MHLTFHFAAHLFSIITANTGFILIMKIVTQFDHQINGLQYLNFLKCILLMFLRG